MLFRSAIKVPAQSGNFSADITHRQNDSLYITISPGMGIEAVRALITPDSFFVHDRINREMSFGSIQFLRRILPFPAASDTLYAAMLGMMAPWVLLHVRRQTDRRRALSSGEDDARRGFLDVLEKLGLGGTWVSADEDVDVAAHLVLASGVLRLAAEQRQCERSLDVVVAVDGGRHAREDLQEMATATLNST